MIARLVALAALIICAVAPARAEPISFTASVVKVVDGDTIDVLIAGLPHPFDAIFGAPAIRVAGIDTPESRMPPGKCKTEVKRGKAATAFAKTLTQPGDVVTVIYLGADKYGGRLDGRIILRDGRDWADVMIAAGYAAPYFGSGPKRNWCARGIKFPKPAAHAGR